MTSSLQLDPPAGHVPRGLVHRRRLEAAASFGPRREITSVIPAGMGRYAGVRRVAAGKTAIIAGFPCLCNSRAIPLPVPSDLPGLFHHADDAPGLRLRELARCLDLDQVARLALVRL